MKKFLSLALVLILLLSVVACNNNPTETPTDAPTDAPTEAPTNPETPTEQPTTPGEEITTGEPEAEIDPMEQTYPWAEVPKTLKILAIGNSFSVDAMEYLYQIAKDAGVETVVLGNLRVSGCTLDMHYDYMTNNTAAYTYLKNTTGTWTSTDGKRMIDGLTDEDWDYVTLQQGSHESGVLSSYDYLNKLCKYVRNNVSNPDVKLLWHMTWAYREGCSHSGFANYDRSQAKMYEMIVKATDEMVLSLDQFTNVIPSGTVVQNVRTSFLGDNINRDDGYHMSQPIGRYLIGLTYFAAITGADISNINYCPSATASPELIAMFKECVTNAMNNKFEVTNSTYTQGSAEIPVTQRTDAALAQAAGIDLSKYRLLEFDYVENKYWYSTKAADAPSNASSSQDGKFLCSKTRYTKEQLMNAVIICDDGWQYRAEKWPNATDLATSRGGNVTDAITVLTADWWGTDTYFAFNLSKTSGEKISSDYAAAATHIRIYVLIEEEA